MMQEEILVALYKAGPLTSEEIASVTKLDLNTVRTSIQKLEKRNLVKKVDKKPRTERGRPEFLYTFTAASNNIVARFLVKQFLEKMNYRTEYEKMLGEAGRIDVFGEREDSIVGVEIKFNGVQWGFLKYKDYLNESYLALPKYLITPKILTKCKGEGVGILQLDSSVKELLAPQRFEARKQIIKKRKTIASADGGMLSQGELELLACFFPKLGQLTLKEVEKRTGYSHEPTFRILEGLAKKHYLQKSQVGKTNLYKFVMTDDALLVFTFYTAARTHELRKREPKVFKRMKEFAGLVDANCVILFGSYAKGTNTQASDIDLLCVSSSKGIERVAAQFRTKYNMVIRPVVVGPKQFNKIKSDNPEFYNDLVEYGIVLGGIDLFFKEVYSHGS